MLELGPASALLTEEVDAAGKTAEVCMLIPVLGVTNVSIEDDLGWTVLPLLEDEELAVSLLLLSKRASSISAWVTDPCLGLCISFCNLKCSRSRSRIVSAANSPVLPKDLL